uniref:Uncharacterized protein n=1 Tax=Candidatus Kentrum sp. TC TaxID=2126339 RepID=A0A450YIM9_9GAMM|nr:MAG: hypothetical protein BECKTC1821E_GA0114239_101145 [Candidatus Kentron sp. TC]
MLSSFKRRVEGEDTKATERMMTSMQSKGIGWQSSWILVMEFFSRGCCGSGFQVGAGT